MSRGAGRGNKPESVLASCGTHPLPPHRRMMKCFHKALLCSSTWKEMGRFRVLCMHVQEVKRVHLSDFSVCFGRTEAAILPHCCMWWMWCKLQSYDLARSGIQQDHRWFGASERVKEMRGRKVRAHSLVAGICTLNSNWRKQRNVAKTFKLIYSAIMSQQNEGH
jgi:hypothetical protein